MKVTRLLIPSNGMTLEGKRRFAGSDAIDAKVISDPIPEGGQQVGIIAFQLDGITPEILKKDGEKLRIKVHDVLGNEVESGPVHLEDTVDFSTYYPGLSHP